MSINFTAGVVRILGRNEETVGTGFVLSDDGLIATCAHVVVKAGAGPSETVTVNFYDCNCTRTAEVIRAWWRAPKVEYVAIIQVKENLPQGVQPLPLGLSVQTNGDSVYTFGFPDTESIKGIWGKGEIIGPVSRIGKSLIQLTSSQITSGFSGAPILDTITNRVVGMVTLISPPDRHGRQRDTAFATPIETLAEINPRLVLRWPEPIETYLASLREHCANFPYLTLDVDQLSKSLNDIYIPLMAQISSGVDKQSGTVSDEQSIKPASDVDMIESNGRVKPIPAIDIIQDNDKPFILLLGEPGAGKSTFLLHVAQQLCDSSQLTNPKTRYLPILISLRHLSNATGSFEDRIDKALTDTLMLMQKLPHNFWTDWSARTNSPWLLLFDSLDEVPTNERLHLLQWLKDVRKRIDKHHHIIITSRLTGFDLNELDNELLSAYILLPFTSQQKEEFAIKLLAGKADAFLKEVEQSRIVDVSGTPLLMTLAAQIYREQGSLPKQRTGLYQQFVDILLKEAEQRGLRNELGERACKIARFAVAHLALVMTKQPNKVMFMDLTQEIADYLRAILRLSNTEAYAEASQFIQIMARRSGLLVRYGDEYEFIHSTIKEFLAAEALSRQSKDSVVDTICSHFWQLEWRQVVEFLSDILPEIIPSMLEKAMDYIPDGWGGLNGKSILKSNKIILVLADYPDNWSARINLHRILKVLVETGCVKLVTTGGATGDIKIDLFRNFKVDIKGYPDLRIKSVWAYASLRSFDLTGQESCYIFSSIPFKLWGVEDSELYRQQMGYFRRGKYIEALDIQAKIIDNFVQQTISKMEEEELSVAVHVINEYSVSEFVEALQNLEISYIIIKPFSFEPDDPTFRAERLQGNYKDHVDILNEGLRFLDEDIDFVPSLLLI